jgi:DNA-binding transcriptional LysR family regulator
MFMINLDWYRSFVAVYRLGTMTAAAGERFLTQPAITQHIAALEAALGTPLFARAARRLTPTPRARALYADVAAALDRLETVALDVRTPAAQQPPLRLGAPLEYFTECVLPRLATTRLQLSLHFDVTVHLISMLERDELDLVIATQRVASRELDYLKLADERFVLVGAVTLTPPALGSTRARNLEQIETWLLEQRWISYGPELPIIRRFWQSAFGRRPPLRPILTLPNLHAIRAAIIAGVGISLLPDYLIAPNTALSRLRVLWDAPAPVSNELWLAYRKGRRADPRIAEFRELCADS